MATALLLSALVATATALDPSYSNSSSNATSASNAVASAASAALVSLRYVRSNKLFNSDLKKDNYGVLRAYPQPFARGINQMRDLSNHIASDWNPELFTSPNPPPPLVSPNDIPIDDRTCSVQRSGTETDPLTDLVSFNCTQACMDPKLLFEPTTFATCMQLATAALWINVNRTRMDTADEQTVKKAIALAVSVDLRDFNGTMVVESMVSCSVAACRTKGKGACGDDIMNLRAIAIEAGTLVNISNVLSRYCDHADSVVNEDVAGPGVLMSYIFQTGIALLFFGLTKLLNSVMRPIFWARYAIKSDTRQTAWRQSGLKQRALSLTRGNAAVISSMIEFQEVQGYFVAAIQVATLVTFRSEEGPDLGTVTSLGSIMFNSGLVQVLAVSGVLPVLLVQCCLQRSGMRWWYTLAISSLVFILGMTVDIRGGYMLPPFQYVFDHFRRVNSIAECGGNPSPLIYCTGDLRFAVSDDLGQSISYWVYPSLLVEQTTWWAWRRYAMEPKARRWEKSKPWAAFFRRRLWPPFWYLYWLALQIVLVLFTSMYFYNIFLLVFEATLMNDQRWTYGQLVALMVWAPILGKYLYFNVFGIEEGFGRRLAKHYKVVQKDYTDSEDEDHDDSDTEDQRMEQGIELKVTPVQSATSLPCIPSPTAVRSPRPGSPSESFSSARSSDITPGPATGPTAGPSTALTNQSSPYSPAGQSMGSAAVPAPSSVVPDAAGVHHPFVQGFGDEGIITAGGVVIAVENHDTVDRPRGDV